MDWNALTLFLMITGRMTGLVLFNPLFGRRGIPGIIKGGFILLLSVSVFALTPVRLEVPATLLGLAFTFLMELFLGYVLGLVINFFFYIPVMAGSVIDMQMGLSMASTYDPASGIQTTVTSNILNALMTLLFFAANGHHTLLRIFANSGLVVPFGAVKLGENFTAAMVQIFLDCTLLGVKLAMPILAAELLGQVGMGILMKAIPQINVFVINIDVKVIIGLAMLMLLMLPISDYLLKVETEMLLAIQRMLPLMSG